MALKGTKMQKPASNPSYEQMIKDAIITLKKRTGSSQFAIAKFMEEKHNHLPSCFRKNLLYHLKRLVASDKLVKVKGSFKLPPTKPKPKRDLKAKEIETTYSIAKVKPKPKPAVMSYGPFRHKFNIINAMPLIVTKPKSKPQTKPKPKPALKETRTKAAAKAKGHKATLINAMPFNDTKPKTVVKTKPKAKATPQKGPAKDVGTLRTSPRKNEIAPNSTTVKATPEEKAPPGIVKRKRALMMNARWY